MLFISNGVIWLHSFQFKQVNLHAPTVTNLYCEGNTVTKPMFGLDLE